ncbi:MAG TPA: hypothetical protein G4O07_00390 [Dehalococcoidia bacterium]|nr:hypothetical protein [Dehalococcoidia bacterium]
MANIEELKREAEEAKERVKRDMIEFRNILRRIANEANVNGRDGTQEAMHKAEKKFEETATRVENRIDKAIAVLTKSVSDTGKISTREYDFSDFTTIEVACCFLVTVTQSDSYQISVTGREKLFSYIDIDKSGSKLRMSIKPFHFHTRPMLKVNITMPLLQKLHLSGAAKARVCGFSSQENLGVNISGASTLDIDIEAGKTKVEVSGAGKLHGNMKIADAEFTLSGASRAELTGSADKAKLSAWGASWLDLGDFVLNDTDIDLKGASQAAIKVNGKLDLELSGGSRLTYGGSPTIGTVNISGASTMLQK